MKMKRRSSPSLLSRRRDLHDDSRATAQATSWKQIPIPPLPAFKPQQPKRIELSNGMVIFLQEDHELPLIDGTARIRGGSRNEPADKVGLVDIYSEVWRTGGTKTQTGDQLDDFLEVRAAKVETGGSPDSTTISWSCLKGDLDDVFKVFADLLQNPEFRADKIDLAQKEEFDGISRRNDQVGEIAQRESVKLAYGADNPYARVPEYATVAAVTRQDLLDWHGKYVHPNNIILGISGDFDSAAMEARLRAAFESWPKGPALPKNEIAVHARQARLLSRPQRRREPEQHPHGRARHHARQSRLLRHQRIQRSLRRRILLAPVQRHPHQARTGLQRRRRHRHQLRPSRHSANRHGHQEPEHRSKPFKRLYEDIDDLSKQPITDEEIQHAKDAILNAFIFRLDSPDKILGERMTYEYYGYPPDWLDKYQAEIKKVTAADVNRVAAKYLHKDQLAVLVVGNTKEFDKPLSSLGAVKEIDITIPPPPRRTSRQADDSAKPAASNPEGKALAAKVAAAMGGLPKLQSIKTMRVSIAESDAGAPPSPVEVTVAFPDSMHVDVQTPQGALTIVATPTTAS